MTDDCMQKKEREEMEQRYKDGEQIIICAASYSDLISGESKCLEYKVGGSWKRFIPPQGITKYKNHKLDLCYNHHYEFMTKQPNPR